MNQQWLTTLMSKGIALEQNLRQHLQSAKESVKSQLEERGIRLSPADFAALVEEVSSKASNAALSYALDMIRPFSAGMGLRISRLSDTQVEVILPARTRNKNENTENAFLHEGAFVTAAIESTKILWSRHAPIGNFEVSVSRLDSNFFKTQSSDCRLRFELSETTRELVLGSLRDRRHAQTEAEVRIFDENDQAVADLHLYLNFKHTPALAGQKAE